MSLLQLTERRKGNQFYRSGDYDNALKHYQRAQAVVEFVQASRQQLMWLQADACNCGSCAAPVQPPGRAPCLQGLGRADQGEVDLNKTVVYLNIAAVHMALQVTNSLPAQDSACAISFSPCS